MLESSCDPEPVASDSDSEAAGDSSAEAAEGERACEFECARECAGEDNEDAAEEEEEEEAALSPGTCRESLSVAEPLVDFASLLPRSESVEPDEETDEAGGVTMLSPPSSGPRLKPTLFERECRPV